MTHTSLSSGQHRDRTARAAETVLHPRPAPSPPAPQGRVWWAEQLAAGRSVAELAAELGCTTMTIYRRLRRVGLARSARPGFDQWLAERTRRDGDCLRWTRAHSSRGFPVTYRDRQAVTVHRVVWEQAHGPIPVGTEIGHVPRCPHRDCVLLEHLLSVTTTAHIADRVHNGAFAHGERHWNAKLTEPEVRAILAAHQTSQVLAARFGVTPGNIRAIRAGRTWRQLQR